MPPAALAEGEFAALMAAFEPFELNPRLAIGVSGGPDSLALTLLAARWAGHRGGAVLGLIVDHGLHPASAAEAAQVAGWLAARSIPCRVLRWDSAKPVTGIQAAAREARHALLEAACREAGILHLLLGHHARDLAETAFIRAERGSGPLGLAGMAAVRERPGIRLLRPLLPIWPGRLAASVEAAGQPWLTDPSNLALAFRRGRLRAEPGEFAAATWLERARQAATVRGAAEEELAAFAAHAVSPDPLGYLTLALDRWRALPAELGRLVLAHCLSTVSGRPYPPASAALARQATALAGATVGRTTLAGVLLAVRGDRLLAMREVARITDRPMLAVGKAVRWDGRYDIAYEAGPGAATVRPLAAGVRLLAASARERLRARRVPAAALAALPALWQGGQLLLCPLPLAGEALAKARFLLRPRTPLAGAPYWGVNVV